MLKFICLVNYGVVLLLGVVSLMAGSVMVYRSLLGMAAYYTEVYKCYTTMYPEYYTTAHVAPTYYAECPKKLWCRAAANVVTMMADRPLVCRYLLGMVGITTTYTTTAYYAETCKCQTTKASEYVGTTVYVGTSYYAEAPK
ncbi:hypothetical protein DAPPUDRAFT_311574 [Daphnia pulex]|uniref:Uncharacterized protein n=1 Tax=Daphnia pulex TaxID=6669 RepID=E9FXA7_DAPPU|nr:hypothetical protein DAPPUDRAFT_311574 [Daphnia pulex]|eukprot:EFX88047.1 hypothetical protein DAPPUDRAFT_311574 [Daphnia pulex]